MRVQVKKIGNYYEKDSFGNLVNPTNWSNVPDQFYEPLREIKNAYLFFYKESLHSLYLRGSLIRGTFEDSISDIDLVGLVHKEIRWECVPFQSSLQEKLGKKYPFIPKLELMVSSYSHNLTESYPALAMILKTQGFCLYGKDIIKILPFCQINQSLAIHYRWLKMDISAFLKKAKKNIADYQSIMKMMVRVGFELVLERSGVYTVDLYPATQTFNQFYPSYQDQMNAVLYFYLNPNENLEKQLNLIETFGSWLVMEVDKQFG